MKSEYNDPIKKIERLEEQVEQLWWVIKDSRKERVELKDYVKKLEEVVRVAKKIRIAVDADPEKNKQTVHVVDWELANAFTNLEGK